MTREEAKSNIEKDIFSEHCNQFSIIEVQRIIDTIYDKFESRTCGNCKIWDEEYDTDSYELDYAIENNLYLNDAECREIFIRTRRNFGCNKWEKKNG